MISSVEAHTLASLLTGARMPPSRDPHGLVRSSIDEAAGENLGNRTNKLLKTGLGAHDQTLAKGSSTMGPVLKQIAKFGQANY